jgi:uncharacterized protein
MSPKTSMTDIAAQPAPATVSRRRLRGVDLAGVRWTSGFWADRLTVLRDSTIPSMRRLMEDTERTHFLENFRIAAGLSQGRHRGPKWNDGDFYKFLEAVAAVYAVTRDPELDAMMDRAIGLIARAQRHDGYIHTPALISARTGGDLVPFTDPMHFEMYNMGHLMLAACVHHRATGKTTLLDVARKAADLLDGEFANPTPHQARHGICPSHLTGLIELYRATGEPRYRDLAARLLDMRDLVTAGDDDNQDRIPFRQQTKAVGHAVRATYLYASTADVYAETGDASLLAPLRPIWDDLVSRKLYITGGCGALFDGASPDGAVDQKAITRVHQAFGRDYQLPHSTAHNETCAAIGNVLWNWRMFELSGEAKYADVVEHTLYNSVLAGVSLDGTRFFYTNTLRQLRPMPVELRWPRSRQAFISCYCCPPNVARTLAELGTYAYATGPDGVHVVLYGANRLETTLSDGAPLALAQETNYPWDGRVTITVDAAPRGECSIFLRIPAWSHGATVRVTPRGSWPVAGPVGADGGNRPEDRPARAGTFHELRRTWARGDTIELDLPMPVRLVEAHPYVEEARNHVAVVRGPVVYCLESPDLPSGVRVMDVSLPRDVRLAASRVADDLAGAVVLEGRGVVRPPGDWSGQLYRDLTPVAPREIDLRLIPYYAWDNRGESEMSVWLPLT